MNLPNLAPIKNSVLLIAVSITCLALAGCGNKGPLVKPSDIPEAAPVASTVSPATAEPIAEPTATATTEAAAEPDASPVAEPASGTPAAQR